MDQSFRLEPTQIAGFNQAFRSLLPESAAGVASAASFESWNLSLEQRIGLSTYAAISGQMLKSRANRTVGHFQFIDDPTFTASKGQSHEDLRYREPSVTFTLDQLLGNQFSAGLHYRLSEASLADAFPALAGVQPFGGFQAEEHLEAVLHKLSLYGIWNHPSGFFSQAEALWFMQNNHGYNGSRPGDEFWQFNIFAGYRFPRRQVEIRLGLLNITDQDYRLNPLNLTSDLPRHRTIAAAFSFYF